MDSSVQQIREKLSITDVVGGYIKLERAGRSLRARCPFHKEKTPSFFLSPERGTYVCFGCGEKGDIFSFVQKMDGVDFPSALRQLAEKAGVTLERYSGPKNEHKEEDERLRDVCEEATKFYEKKRAERPEVEAYIHTRGVSADSVREWRIGYAPASWREVSEHLQLAGFTKDEIVAAGLAVRSEKKPGEIYDRFRGRIMFPLSDASGRVIAFSGRFFERLQGEKEDVEPAKYVNSPETPLFKKSKVLYGFDKAKNFIRKADCILLVEGQFDVVLSHQSGLPFTCAISGTALTPEHLSLLGRLSKRLILALDGDAAGIRSGLKSSLMALQSGFEVKVPVFPDGKDPADLARENPELLKAAIRTSKTAVEFFLDVFRSGARDEYAYQKTVETQVLPLLGALQSKIDQGHFVRIVAQRLRVPESAVQTEMLKHKALPMDGEVLPEQPLSPSLVQQGSALSQFERVLSMLLFHATKDTTVREKIDTLVTHERAEAVYAKHIDEAEQFRMAFDALGEDPVAVTTLLLLSLERLTLEEHIASTRQALRSAEVLGKTDDVHTLSTRLTELVRRKDAIRG